MTQTPHGGAASTRGAPATWHTCRMSLSRGRRSRRRRGAVALGVVVAGLVAGCGPRSVSLEDLAVDASEYHGEEVTVRGVVLEFGDDEEDVPHHFVIQDSAMNRVELAPAEEAEPYVDSTVEAHGLFQFDPERGRMLHIDEIDHYRGSSSQLRTTTDR